MINICGRHQVVRVVKLVYILSPGGQRAFSLNDLNPPEIGVGNDAI